MLLSFAAIWLLFSRIHLCVGSSLPKVITQFAPPSVQQSWAAYTPYFSVQPYTPPPSNCHITQVNILQRHGARFPTSGATTGILAAVTKLQSATNYSNPKLDFLRNYAYTLGKNGDLVPFGAFQSEEAGKTAYTRYSWLIFEENLPFVRASSSERVVDSATNWTLGFSIASNHVFNPKLSVILSENLNDTLDDSMCPNAGSSDPQTDIWTAIYGAPIADRLNRQAPGANLTAEDISNLIPLCPFESVANGMTSPFCAIFTPEDFAQFEYFGDLDKFYGTGYGQALGPIQGVGYVNELLARLTRRPVADRTQTNRTLDAARATFPLDRAVYADFSHDNQMAAVYAALGLFRQPRALDPTKPSPGRTWVTSRLTPFSARMVAERLHCTTGARGGKAEVFVRILVNDALQPLEFCGGDRRGLCTLDAFVESQAFARSNGAGDFEKCFE
ncbi:phytase [Pholiota molesta]|nr:phytase [Pholiota molesta]